MFKSTYLILFLSLILGSCTYDVLEVDDEEIANLPTVVPDSTSYAMDVAPILDRSCNNSSCHFTPGSPRRPPLDTYSQLKVQVDNGEFERVVFIDMTMPKQTQIYGLSDIEYAILRKWLDEGARNN